MIDALSFFGSYPFRRLFAESLAEVATHMRSKGFKKIYLINFSSLFYRDPFKANRIALNIYRRERENIKDVEIDLLGGTNPSYVAINNIDIEEIVEPYFRAYVMSPAYHGFRLDAKGSIKLVEDLCSQGRKIVILDLLEDIREMHRAYKLIYMVKDEHLERFLRNIDKICGKKILLASFRYELLKNNLARISDLELYVDTSSDTLYGYQYDRVRELVDSIGEDLVVLATRTPIAYTEAAVFRVIYSDIADSAKKKILYDNALKYYEI